MQDENYETEIEYLMNETKIKTVPPLVKNLDLFLDKRGILRTKGRIGKTQTYDFDVINPIMLGKKHKLTELLVESFHSKIKHLGLQSTLTAVRLGGFWIPRMRQSIKSIIKPCVTCQKINSLAFKYPKMTNLPKGRVNFVKPFLHTGIDFTGHLYVKNSEGKNVKMYLLIFTCLNVRAIHIELVPDMTVNQFILAFQRFICQFGILSHICSDNALSFISGMKFLEEVISSNEFSSKFDIYNIKHVRIPAYSVCLGRSEMGTLN